MSIIGRSYEQNQLKNKLYTNKSELIAVIGRRRVGKTYLVRNTYQKEICFYMTGLFEGTVKEHMERFTSILYKAYGEKYEIEQPKNWFEAFDLLREFIEYKKTKSKKVIFLDEFPWMATNKSRFITAFSDFWNSFGVSRNDLIVVICGSAASWMIKNVLKNRGGLYNRVTDRIILEPFNLYETELFLKAKGIICNRFELTQLYMALGGIPYYIDQIERGESIAQAMDRIFFKRNASMQIEYKELMTSLFDRSVIHEDIIEVLAKYPSGLSRTILANKCKSNSGGGFTDILEELIASGFLHKEIPYGNIKKDALYKIKDPYILFYHKYVKPRLNTNQKIWEKLSTLPTWKSWSGLAFENVCKFHIAQIRKALKIEGIISTEHTWFHKGNDDIGGAQCDLIIDRSDNVINLCEIKFSDTPYVITKKYIQIIYQKINAFKYFNPSNKSIFLTFISARGLQRNKYSDEIVQNHIKLDHLFEKIDND